MLETVALIIVTWFFCLYNILLTRKRLFSNFSCLRMIKEATSRYFESGLLRKKNTKWVILKQNGTRMAEDGED